jgi:hypothetical protein
MQAESRSSSNSLNKRRRVDLCLGSVQASSSVAMTRHLAIQLVLSYGNLAMHEEEGGGRERERGEGGRLQ